MKLVVSIALAAGALLALSVPASAGEKGCDKDCPKARAAADTSPIAATPRAEAPSQGPRDAKVTVEVWSDFQCPFCARGAERLAELRQKYGERLRIVFRHQPLPFHDKARLAAAAAMAAHAQGRFWEYHDGLFAQQRALDRASLEALAQTLGLDLPRFRHALDTGAHEAYLDAEVREAQRRGVTGTPTFFVNGTPLVGAQPLDAFVQHIDAALRP
jgi:protein-disulfide isomerase